MAFSSGAPAGIEIVCAPSIKISEVITSAEAGIANTPSKTTRDSNIKRFFEERIP